MSKSASYEIVNYSVIFFSIFFLIYVLEVILLKQGIANYTRITMGVIVFYIGMFLAYYRRNEPHILINTIARITFIGGIIIAARSKGNPEEHHARVLVLGFVLPLLMFLVYSIIFLVGKFTSFTLVPIPHYTKTFLYPQTSHSPESLAKMIIFTNISLVAILIFGSFLLLTGSFLNLLSNSALLTSLLIYSRPSEVFYLILPNGLLEIAGIFISTQVGLLLLYYLVASLQKNIDLKARKRLRFIMNSAVYLLFVILILFLLAWGVEFFNIIGYTQPHTFAPILTYRIIIASDLILIAGIIYIVFLMIWEKYVNIMRFSFFLIFPSIMIAVTYPSLKSHHSLPIYSVVFIFFSLFYLLSDIFTEYKKRRSSISGQKLVKYGLKVMLASGRSMFPTIEGGDILIVRDTSEGTKLKEGDIVVFTPRVTQAGLTMERYIAHRLIEIGDSRIITKGDAHSSQDPWTPIENVSGKVIGKVLIRKNQEEPIFEPLSENMDDLNSISEIIGSKELHKTISSLKNPAKKNIFLRFSIVTAISILLSAAIFII